MDQEDSVNIERVAKAASPRLIGISSPKTWDQWIKKSPSAQSSVEVDDEDKKEDIVVVKQQHGECSVQLVEESSKSPESSPEKSPVESLKIVNPPETLHENTTEHELLEPQHEGEHSSKEAEPPIEEKASAEASDTASVEVAQEAEEHSSLNTIDETEEDGDEPSAEWRERVRSGTEGTSKTVRIKLDDNGNPNKVVIKNTRFKVIPAVDVWEPKDNDDVVCVGDPMTMIESHLNQLTMVESQLKKLGKDSEALKMKPLKLDLDDDKSKKKSDKKLGWLSIFKKKPPTPTEPTPPAKKPVEPAKKPTGPQTVRSQRATQQKTRKPSNEREIVKKGSKSYHPHDQHNHQHQHTRILLLEVWHNLMIAIFFML